MKKDVVVRNRSINAVKGCLILTVVIGHVLLGTLDGNILRYVIYSFHMPAFFFISGYLFKKDKLCALSFTSLIRKYWKRMLLPWLLAWLVYTSIQMRHDFSVISLLSNIANPWYHLWFIPELMFDICITWSVFRLAKNAKNSLSCYVLLFVIALFSFNLYHTQYVLPTIVRLRYFLFFLTGVVFGNELKRVKLAGGVCHFA